MARMKLVLVIDLLLMADPKMAQMMTVMASPMVMVMVIVIVMVMSTLAMVRETKIVVTLMLVEAVVKVVGMIEMAMMIYLL